MMRGSGRLIRGFTLLEVLLALALSVVLMMLIGGAFEYYTQDLNARDMEVQQVRIATAVLQMIENDLRSTIHPKPIDTEALKALLSSAGGTAAGGSGAPGGATSAESPDLSAAGIASELDTTAVDPAANLNSSTMMLQTPGLVGTSYEIQVDVSRLPRLEEYQWITDANTADLDDIPSDIKTITYYVQSAGVLGGAIDPLDAAIATSADGSAVTSPGGLVRRILDRAVTGQAMNNGGTLALGQSGELLAPEVVSIEFSYWDGLIWQVSWDSDSMGELPLAIQVTIDVIASSDVPILAADPAALEAMATRTFMHTIRLPVARPVDTTVTTETNDTSASSSGSTASGAPL